jgi:hypothetical protein
MFKLVAGSALLLGIATATAARLWSAQLVPAPADLRFRLVGDEPIAGPDGRSTVSRSKVLVFRDMKTGECYVTFVLASGTSTVGQGPCAHEEK